MCLRVVGNVQRASHKRKRERKRRVVDLKIRGTEKQQLESKCATSDQYFFFFPSSSYSSSSSSSQVRVLCMNAMCVLGGWS